MILFPPCKVNIGLDITAKRPDGYHNIETLMIQVKELCDSLEIVRGGDILEFSSSGLSLDCTDKDNIAAKAWMLMREKYGIGGVKAHLHKAIPFGAGLGGGSSDAAYMLRGLNALFSLNLSSAALEPLAAQLGSDVPLFLYDTPRYCTGRGEIMKPFDVGLSGLHIVIIKPIVSISTAQAYSGITPYLPTVSLEERLLKPVSNWKGTIGNDFEKSVFCRYPQLADIKSSLYEYGAVYASMSGSGSAIYGIFDHKPNYAAKNTAIESCGIYRL